MKTLPEPFLALADSSVNWPQSFPAERKAYLQLFLNQPSRELVRNITTRFAVLRVADEVVPVTVNDGEYDNSYLCSLYGQYALYPAAELQNVAGRLWGRLAGAAFPPLGAMLRASSINKVVQINNWLLSTNLIDRDWFRYLPAMTRDLVDRYPDHAILIRNIDRVRDDTMMGSLEALGYRLITSRQVYFFDGRSGEFTSKSTFKRDLKLLRQQREYRVLVPDDFVESDAPRLCSLYRQLYLEKHSRLNPEYTQGFVRALIQSRFLRLYGLRHQSGRIDGVWGLATSGEMWTVPFVGYDLSLPQETGLYRMLVALLLEKVAEEKRLLNYSSGAGEFKRRRGGRPEIECNAIYVGHLPPWRRSAVSALEFLANRWGRDYLVRHEV